MRPALPVLFSLLFGLGASAACGSPAPAPDAGLDASAEDAAPRDAGVDAPSDAGPLPCPEALAERRVALDRSATLTQIHPAAAWDGEGIWIAYVRPEASGGGGFDVFATRIACDGRPLVEPFLASSDPSYGNDIDPDLAIDGDRMLIAWPSDDGTGGTDNLQVRYRLFDVDGTPRGDDRTLRTSYEGAPVTDNHLGVKLATRPGGGFVVAGARALPGIDRFTAYAQPLTADGELDGEALNPEVEMAVGQTAVAVDVADDGMIWVAYDRQPDGGEPAVYVGALGGDPPAPALDDPPRSSGAGVLAAGGHTWVAFSGEAGEIDLRLVDVRAPLTGRTPAVVGAPARIEHLPRLAQASDGAMAIAWFRQIRGFTNELLVAPFTPAAAGAPSVGAEVRVDRSGAPSYEPTLTHVMDDYWFLAFAEGDSPDFRLVGRFVRLPAP